MKKVEVIKYCIYFVLFTFLHYVGWRTGIRAFAVAFFFGLVYNRANVLVISPLYVAAAVICEFAWQSAVIAVIPPVVAAVALFFHYKLRKKPIVSAVAAYAVVSAIPRIAFTTLTIKNVVMFCVSTLLTVPLTFVFVAVIYLVTVKKFAFKITPKEFLSVVAVLVTLGAGLSDVAIEGVKVYYAVLTLFTSLSAFASRRAGLAVALAMGLGGALRGDVTMFALSALYGGCITCFNPNYGYFGGVIAFLFNVAGVVFGVIGASYYSLIPPAVGIIISIVVPSAVKRKISALAHSGGDGLTRSVINKDRAGVALKVECLGAALKEMSSEMSCRSHSPVIEPRAIAKTVAEKCCACCPQAEECRNALGGSSTEIVIVELAESAVTSGRASILDASPFLSSRCRRLNGVISAINAAITDIRSRAETLCAYDDEKTLLKEQVEGLAEVLEGISEEIATPLLYDKSTEHKLYDALNARSVALSDVCVSGEKVCFTVGEEDSAKPKIKEIVSEVMGKPMRISSVTPTVNGKADVFLEPTPKYRVAYGERVVAAESDGCGDKESVVKLGSDKVMVILSDGMGHGKEAGRNSSRAVSLISSFYRAGLDHKTVLKSVARLLKLGGKEEFNAVDIAVIDTFTGDVDVIKQGARESYILTDGAVEVVECGSLPLGIVDDAVPFTSTFRLTTNSFLVLVSDGVADVIGTAAMVDLLSAIRTRNPDDVSSAVMDNVVRLCADNGKVKDDASVVTVRLF